MILEGDSNESDSLKRVRVLLPISPWQQISKKAAVENSSLQNNLED